MIWPAPGMCRPLSFIAISAIIWTIRAYSGKVEPTNGACHQTRISLGVISIRRSVSEGGEKSQDWRREISPSFSVSRNDIEVNLSRICPKRKLTATTTPKARDGYGRPENRYDLPVH